MSELFSSTMWRRLAVLGGLGAAAFVAPILDIYGQNPEVFVANRTNATEIVTFGLIVVLLIPVVAWCVLAIAGAVGGRAPEIAYRVMIAMLALGAGLVVSRQVAADETLIAIGVAVAIAALVFWLAKTIDLVFVIAAIAIPVLLVMFLATSATARLIWNEPE
ncbi:MAG: hypothetical protein WAL25_09765, partial [Acidimicrobiia bacterium]